LSSASFVADSGASRAEVAAARSLFRETGGPAFFFGDKTGNLERFSTLTLTSPSPLAKRTNQRLLLICQERRLPSFPFIEVSDCSPSSLTCSPLEKPSKCVRKSSESSGASPGSSGSSGSSCTSLLLGGGSTASFTVSLFASSVGASSSSASSVVASSLFFFSSSSMAEARCR